MRFTDATIAGLRSHYILLIKFELLGKQFENPQGIYNYDYHNYVGIIMLENAQLNVDALVQKCNISISWRDIKLPSFQIHTDNDTTRFWFKFWESYFFFIQKLWFVSFLYTFHGLTVNFWSQIAHHFKTGMVFILFNNYHMQKIRCLSQITSALLSDITVLLKSTM